VPDLDYRFDDITEKYASRQLAEIRDFARQHVLPDRLTLEIGSNRGRFIRAMAERDPDRAFLGVEMRYKYVETAREELAEHRISNAWVLCADVNHVLPVVIDDGQLTDVFLLYPDPWWKRQHRKRRVIQPAFLDRLAPKMAPGGKLWIRTDVGPFADDMRDVLVEHPDFEPTPAEDFPDEPFPRSTREKHVVREGIPVNLVYFQRAEQS
jgi:tRNA (guanine-N7-)-methyltransferase